MTSSPLYCFKQCRRRLVLANQKDVISKSSLFCRMNYRKNKKPSEISIQSDDQGRESSLHAGTHLEDLLDVVDGGGEQRLHLLVVVDVVGVADAHEEDVGGQTRDGG